MSMGLHLDGFRVIGVDKFPQPDYPFEFIEADALQILPSLIHFYSPAVISASPPCQASCTLTAGTNKGREYPQLIPKTRQLLQASGLPYIIENVAGADIRKDVMLCGEMFSLDVQRHRFFECGGWTMQQPKHIKHRGRVAGWRHGTYYDGPYFAVYGEGGGKGTVEQWQWAMGIDWTVNRKSIAEAIPPAYGKCLGEQLIKHVRSSALVSASS